MAPRGARRAAGCLLLCWALAAARAAPRRKPSFGGHVAENRPAGTRVRGLSIPLTRLGPEPWCAKVQGRRWHLQLLGEGRSHFQASLHARTARVWLRTRRPLDREARALYSLRLGLCCKRCPPRGPAAAELAALTVRVLDENDNAPRFVGGPRPGVTQLRVEETLALKSQVWQARAEDADAGANAELRYFALPPSAHFFVVPRSGRVVLVRSLLHLRAPISLRLYARDRGRPALLSDPLELEVLPQPKRLPPLRPAAPRRRRAALPSPAAPPALSLPEDARPGSRLATLAPAPFASAWFELVSPPVEESPVAVERESGEVTLAAALDREAAAAWHLVVRVRERRGKDWYLVHLTLTVTDVNDNVPEWAMEPFPFLAVVSPEAAGGTEVYKLFAVDADEGIHGAVEYFLLEGGEDRFEVEKDTGWVKTTGLPLVRDKEYLLTVIAADKLGSRGSPACVSVIAGFRPPQFTNLSYFVYVPESMPQGKCFLTVTAISYQKKSLSYSLLTNPSGLFSIDGATGDISLTRSVDCEGDQHQYLLLVRAEENQEQFSSAAEVLVVITDVNDCAPEFHQSIYSKVGVPETVTKTTALLQVTATDCDSKENAELLYYTLSQDFSITPHGTIFPATQLDYERPNHLYEFIIMAVDKGKEPKTGTATVRIRVSNVNDEAPVFSQTIYRSFVSEDAGPNTLIVTVNAVDPDGDGVTYNILSGNQKGNFVIDPKKGLVRLRSSPFPELQGTEYVLNVTATDDNASGGPHSLTSTAQVVVKIDDVNNNKPVFQKCQYYWEHASVLENQPSGTVVMQVEATDADEGANGVVKYGLMHRGGVLPAFSIHPDTGVLTTVQVFDREKQREYPITVTATDQAAEPLIGICQINIIILDQNDNDPRFENTHYEYFLREDTRVGTSFLRVAARDDDYSSNATITYSIANEEPNCLQINPTTGWVFVNQPISQRSSIIREIIATDGGNRSSKVELAVTITSAKNQPPQWERDSYEVVIPENTTRDASILTIKATSPLGDPHVTYNLVEGLVPETNMPVRFYLTPNRHDGSASILVAEPLDYETTKSFLLRVRALNIAAVPLAAFATVYINLTDVNDNVPFFTSSIYEASVTEGADVGTFVVQVFATDLDLGQNGEISYSLLHDSGRDYMYFGLDSQTGSIFTVSVFDREKKGSYLLEVKSVDGSQSARPGKQGKPNSDTAYVRIFISDVNDNKPVFTQSVYEVNVDEDQDVGLTIITVSANDDDEGTNAKLRYQITAGNTGGVLDVEPETGAIFIAQPLDYEETKMYEIHLMASDGKWEDYAVIIINVMNKNDETPVFSISEYYGSIIEELDGLPVFVLQVIANDPDSNVDEGDLRYSLHGHGAADIFTVDEKTGSIYSHKMLDREERALWRFVVLATDEGGEGLTGFADVIINVWDINDNAPMFTCIHDHCNGSVSENSPADYQNSSDFSLTDNRNNTATVTALRSFDREKQKVFHLPIVIMDSGMPAMSSTNTLTITIGDENDNCHESGHKEVYVYSYKGKWSTTVLGEVFAPDQDDWDNKTFLSEGKLLKSFRLNQRTGSLVMVDNTPQGIYNLKVRVSDGVCPDVISTVQIRVKELENEAMQNSATVRLSGVTAEEFIRRDEHGKTRHEKFKELLAKMLPAKLSDIIVFSVMNTDGKQTDVRFAVRGGSVYYRPEKLHAEMAAFKNEIQSALQLNISQIDIDECGSANCSEGNGCTNYLGVSDSPTVMDTGSVSFVSVTTTINVVCTCSARDRVHQSCSSYPRSPCLNGGMCIDTLNGYRCLCPASFHGPECQQTKHSFHGNGYAWFRPIRPCFEISLSLEFITVVPDGLLLYSGPLSNPEPGNTENFIAIELSSGIPVLKMSHGSGFVMLQFPSHLNVADEKWHQLEVRTNGQEVRFTLDHCSAAVVSEIEGVGKWLSTEDRTNCEVFGSVPRRARYLNVNHVLQLGGVKESLPYSYPHLLHKHFSGCLRNFILDTQVYDLQSPAESLNSFPGCTLTDGICETMGSSYCGIHGRCLGDWGSFACHCLPGYYGYQCEKVAKEYTFGPGSHVRYQLPVSVPARRTLFEAMIRTRQPDSVITSMLSRNKDEHITLQVVQGFLVVSYNLGDGDYSVSLPSYHIDNGEWHHITLERNENEFTLRLYEGGGKREILKAAGTYKEIVIDPSSLVLGNTYPFNQNKSFQGCMKDVRFNNYRIPLDTHVKELVSVLSAQGVKEGCSSEACRNNPCNQEFICIDLWMMHECSCPPGHMMMENATGRQCVYTACAKRPCNYGTCISQSPTKFQCHCPDGYTGHNCEITLAIFHKDTGLSFSSVFAICICFLALLGSYGNYILYYLW
ncbi:neural-cadherin-like isoform X3 [Phalacrocorax aristotelis]|uniref:neural-cadherin-like isoform X3 n=1 Tax=Phalacrocorax aristotelis TaxID=126867 RepID=UPI003F4C2701